METLRFVINSSDIKGTHSFARQLEPDLKFTDKELIAVLTQREMSPLTFPEKSRNGHIIFWMFLVILTGRLVYLATTQSAAIIDGLGPYLENLVPASKAVKPETRNKSSSLVTLPNVLDTTLPTLKPLIGSFQATPSTSVTASPLFTEGQKVTFISDQPTLVNNKKTSPTGSLASISNPNPHGEITLTVIDSDLQHNGWIYLVRTEAGRTGWVSEKHLRMKR